MTKIIEALHEILALKNYTTINELASLTGKKRIDVLRVINNNSHLIRIDKKTGRILGFEAIRSKALENAFNDGLTYKIYGINYGADSELATKNPAGDKLRTHYICGGIGDSYTIRPILDRLDNRKALEDMGIVESSKFETPSIFDLWKES